MPSYKTKTMCSESILTMKIFKRQNLVDHVKDMASTQLREAGVLGDIDFDDWYCSSFSVCTDEYQPDNDFPHHHLRATGDALGEEVA